MLIDATDTRWFRFLSRWSVVAGLLELGLVLVMTIGVQPASQNSRLPEAYAEFVAASHIPALYRVAATLDAATWLAIGGFLLIFAALFAHRAPIRSTFIAACGVGQVAGIIGAFIRLDGTTNLAARYLTVASDQQAALLRSYLDLQLTFTTHFNTGELLYAAAYLLVASITWSFAEFPRWLTIGLAVLGMLGLTQLLYHVVTGGDQFVIFFLQLFIEIVAFFAVGWVFWRRRPTFTPVGSSAPAN